jgi:hypothetical protein
MYALVLMTPWLGFNNNDDMDSQKQVYLSIEPNELKMVNNFTSDLQDLL